jgi:ABC-2 type transport system permease protein
MTMVSMRKIIAIAWTDIKIEFSSRSALIFFLLLPLIFTTIIGIALANIDRFEADDPRIPVLVVNADGQSASIDLLNALHTSEVIRPAPVDADQAAAAFSQDGMAALLTIPEDFSRSLLSARPVTIDLQIHPQNTNGPLIEQAVAMAACRANDATAAAQQSVLAAERFQPFASPAQREVYFQASLVQARALLDDAKAHAITVHGAARQVSPSPSGFKQSSPGQLVSWTLITLTGAASVFVNERLSGTLRRLLITPASKVTLLMGKIAGRLMLGWMQMGLLVLFGAFVLGVNWGNSPLAIAILLITFGLAATALGVMLGAFARTRSQAGGLSVLVSMLLASLGGAWWPLEITPPLYQTVVKALPSTWAMTGLSDIITRGGGAADILLEAGILLAFSAVFFVIGLKRLRFE